MLDGPRQPGGNIATTQDGTIAGIQCTIAELRRERDAHRAATTEVLKTIAACPANMQPVFGAAVAYRRNVPYASEPAFNHGHALLANEAIHIRDYDTEPVEYRGGSKKQI